MHVDTETQQHEEQKKQPEEGRGEESGASGDYLNGTIDRGRGLL